MLGLRGAQTWLLGEARWQSRPLGRRELAQLRRKTARTPNPVADPRYVLWSRGGVDESIGPADALAFTPEQMLAPVR